MVEKKTLCLADEVVNADLQFLMNAGTILTTDVYNIDAIGRTIADVITAGRAFNVARPSHVYDRVMSMHAHPALGSFTETLVDMRQAARNALILRFPAPNERGLEVAVRIERVMGTKLAVTKVCCRPAGTRRWYEHWAKEVLQIDGYLIAGESRRTRGMFEVHRQNLLFALGMLDVAMLGLSASEADFHWLASPKSAVTKFKRQRRDLLRRIRQDYAEAA